MRFFPQASGRGRYQPSLALYHESSIEPRPRDAILWYGRRRVAMHADQAPARKNPHPALDRALGQASGAGDGLVTRAHNLLPPSDALAPEMQIDEVRGWCAVMSHQIAHQDVQNIIIQYYSNEHYSMECRIANSIQFP